LIRISTDLNEVIERGGTVVVPSRQRAHAARLGHSAARLAGGGRVWATPDILSFDAWLTREIERHAADAGANLPRLLSPAEDWLLWRQCTADATGDLDLVNRGALAEALRRASALAADFQIDVSRSRDMPGTESALLSEVQRAVDERCRSLGAAHATSLLAGLPCVGDSRPVVFAGFLNLSPRLEAITAARRERGYQAGPKVAAEGVGAVLVRPRAIVAADESEELERIAEWCKAQIERQADARILVVLPGAPSARERVATLIRQAVDPQGWATPTNTLVVIEGGSPLARVPVVAHALAALRWLGGNAGDFESLSEWLRAPYWNTPPTASRARLDLWLRERGRMHLDLRQLVATLNGAPPALTEAAREIATQITNAAATLGQGTASAREWSERFRAALAVFAWPGERVRGSSEQQTLVRFHELLDEFGQLAAATGSMSRDSAIQWFIELAARTAFRPADDDAVVTIAPLFADPVVHYDATWVGGLNAEAFPQPVQPDPFLPLAAQLAAGVPAASAAGRLAESRTLMAAWRAAAGELVLSVPARSEDLELLPSPLLAEWLVNDMAPRPARPSVWLPARMHREGLLETLDDPAGLAWPVERPLPSGTRSLELQNQCPFRAYAELRLGSTELGVPEPGVAPDLRGQLLHAALQRLWKRVGDSHALLALSEAALEGLISQSVAEAADATLGPALGGHSQRDLWDEPPPGSAGDSERPPAFARECRRAMRLIRVLCDLERERAPFRVQDTEFESTLTLMGARLHVRVDRLDVLESGGRAILDYKSGRRTTADWYGDRPSHPQLLAYLAAIGEDVVAMATVNVTAREVRFDGVASSPDLLPKVKGVEAPDGADRNEAWRLRRREWLACVERLAGEFLAGRAAVDPKPGACDFCHVTSVCRISDRAASLDLELDSVATETVDD
jgi:ATP-dependent helicase/nuclease subunit B